MRKLRKAAIWYLVSIGSTFAVVGLGRLLDPFLQGRVLFLFLADVVLVSLYGGYGPAVLSSFLSAALYNYFFQYPLYTFSIVSVGEWIELIALLGVGLLLGTVGASFRKARNVAENALREREDLIAIVSHDLRNPLSAIELGARLILKQESDSPASSRMQHQAEVILRTSQRMNALIGNILDLERIRSGKFSLELRPDSARHLLGEAQQVFAPLAAQKSQELEVIWPEPDLELLCDPDRVLQALSNLLGNAIKFSPDGAKITLSARALPGAVSFAVEDTGPGIPDTDLPHIFDRYWQASRSAKPGTGLGLSIAQGIAEAHGGRISVSSALGKGTIFRLVLPLGARFPVRGPMRHRSVGQS